MTPRPRAALAAVTALLVACGGPAASPPSTGFESVSAENPRDLPLNLDAREGRQGPNGGTILAPISRPIDEAVAYRFSLDHCGLRSPIDVDGSFWNPVDGVTPSGAELDLETDAEMINATAGLIVIIGDEARFRTASGSVVRFERHDGEMEFPGCD